MGCSTARTTNGKSSAGPRGLCERPRGGRWGGSGHGLGWEQRRGRGGSQQHLPRFLGAPDAARPSPALLSFISPTALT